MQNPAPAAAPARSIPWVWAVLAACCPLAACPVTPVVAVASSGAGRHPAELFQQGGMFAWATLGVFVLSALALTVLTALIARGFRIPVTLPTLLALLPWATGVGGMRSGLSMVVRAIENVNPADKATILAAGIAEASSCRLLGTFLSSGLLAATGLALALGAFANSVKPKPLGLLVGAAVAVPALGACFLVPDFRNLGASGFLPVLPAAALVFSAGLGGLGASGDRRASLIAGTLGIPAALAVPALASGVAVAGMMKLFGALATVSPDQRAVLAMEGALELGSADKLAALSLGLGAIAAVGLAALGFRRTSLPDEDAGAPVEPSVKKALVIELALCACLGGLVVGADRAAVKAAATAIDTTAQAPWAIAPAFQPLHASGPQQDFEPWLLTPERLVHPGHEAIEQPFSAAGIQKLKLQLEAAREEDEKREELRRMLHPMEPPERRLSVAVDARVRAEDFGQLVTPLREAGYVKLELVGQLPARPELAAGSSWWLGLLGSSGAEEVWLVPDRKRTPNVVKPRELERVLNDTKFQAGLELSEYSLQSIVDAAAKARDAGHRAPLLVGPDGVPPLPSDEAEPDADQPPRPQTFEPEVEPGSKEAIAATVKKALPSFKRCYADRLRQKPKLGGKVVLDYTIAADGTVKDASVSSTTAHDKKLEDCLVGRMRSLRFVAPGSEMRVSYPFVFTPQ